MNRTHRNCLLLAAAFSVSVLMARNVRVAAQQQHPGEYSPVDIETGSILHTAQCVTCHGATGDGVAGVDLRRGMFRRAANDEDLRRVITSGVPGASMPKFDFTPEEQNAVVAFIRANLDVGSRAAKVGDAARGKAVYDKGGCANCHRIGGVGLRKGPDLTDIGGLRTPTMLQQTLVDPTAYLLPINRPVLVTTKDGKTVSGRRLNEDTYSVQLIDDSGRLVSLLKSDLKEFQVQTTSPMPSYRDKLSPDEIADLVAYLLSLKG
jgi:cytochrome c oxidase cbb3-type subunit 3